VAPVSSSTNSNNNSEQSTGSSGSQGSTASSSNVSINGPYNQSRDLVALHFDHAPDRDDGHAAVAALMVVNKLGLNVHVVAGTYGEYSRDRFVGASVGLMNSVWGSQWHNAHRNFAATVSSAADRWSSVIAGGGTVWIAEGGPSDFTAAVLRRIHSVYPNVNTSQRIALVQHSDWILMNGRKLLHT